MTRKTRLGTYGSVQEGEDMLLAQICKLLPLPAFVPRTPRPAGFSSAVLFVPGLRFGRPLPRAF